MTEIPLLLSTLLAAPAERAALATLVSVEGSSYRRPGARLVLLEGGTRAGAISGGCLEDDILLHAQQVLASGKAKVVTYNTASDNDLVWGTGTGCNGVIRVLIEPVARTRPAWVAELSENQGRRLDTELAVVVDAPGAPLGTCLARELPTLPWGARVFRETVEAPPSLIIFGAGDDSQPLVRMAKELGWHITLVDSRAAYASRMRFPEVDELRVIRPEEVAERLEVDGKSYVVVMTHRFREDAQLLRFLLFRPLAYLGLLGARERTGRLKELLAGDPEPPLAEHWARICAPVGLDLGGTTPETIALAILAELQARRSGRIPAVPRERRAPLHVS